jgi:hypothetical protein
MQVRPLVLAGPPPASGRPVPTTAGPAPGGGYWLIAGAGAGAGGGTGRRSDRVKVR